MPLDPSLYFLFMLMNMAILVGYAVYKQLSFEQAGIGF